MSYLPLARKYRPSTFEELVGQDGVATALSNAIRLGREPHAVIFSGVRGIGKTTTARLYAKALNCKHGPTPKPCDACESCEAIVEGRHEDVLEIDGASNTGVDDVRALRETVSYVPQRSKYKVYIIDEVHMLSQSAFNALLKTLEEPPPHVVFVFATTELHKIPQTILSRCQTFYLQRFSPLTVIERLRVILASEKIEYEDKALALVAREGHGSMRDSLTFLDQAIALGEGKVTVESLSALISNVSASSFIPLLNACITKRPADALAAIQAFDHEGQEFGTVVEETAKLTRHAFVIKDLGKDALDTELLGLDKGEVEELANVAQMAAPFDLNRIFRTLVKCRTDMDGSSLDRYILENYILEWCLDPGLPSVDDLINLGASGAHTQQRQQPIGGASTSNTDQHRDKKPRPRAKKLMEQIKERSAFERESPPVNALVTESPQLPKEFPESWRALVEQWKQQRPIHARIVEEAYLVEYSAAKIHIAVPSDSLSAEKLLDQALQGAVAKVFREMFGFTGQFVVSRKEEERQGAETATESLLDIKNREKMEKKRAIIEKARQNPITQSVIAAFDAEIEDIIVD